MITEEKVRTLENYIIGRIEDLENQNSNLQAQINSLKDNKQICFMAFDNSVDLNGKYLIEIKEAVKTTECIILKRKRRNICSQCVILSESGAASAVNVSF